MTIGNPSARLCTLGIWLVPGLLPAIWGWTAGSRAIGRRTGDLVSHIWALWNGGQSDPTRTVLFGWPDGIDLLPIYGGWLHTFVGTVFVRAGAEPVSAYTAVICIWLLVAGLGGTALARAVGSGSLGALVGGLLLQLDGFVLYSAMDGRPEHAGLGFTALALAAAIALWKTGGRRVIVGTAALGALVFVVSWEHALWLALALGWLAPWLVWTTAEGRRPAILRWSWAGLAAGMLAAPWIGLFFSRALAVRDVAEGHGTLLFSVDQAIALGDWLVIPGGHPGRGLVLLAGGLPFLVPRAKRTLAWGVVLGLVLSVVLALGPSPGFWRSGDLWTSAQGQPVLWGPFARMQQLPVLGWFHSPGRLAMGVSMAVAAGGALLVDRVVRWRLAAGLALALALPVYAGTEAWMAGNWPRPAFDLPSFPEVATLASRPEQGGVLALPPALQGHEHEQRVVFQLLHQRPILGHIYLPHLARDQTPDLLREVPFFAWVAGVPELRGQPAPEWTASNLATLRRFKIAFVTVHRREIAPDQRAEVLAKLTHIFGKPVAHRSGVWTAFAVPPADGDEP